MTRSAILITLTFGSVANAESVDELRRYVTDQPKTFENDVFSARDGDDFVRSDHLVEVSDAFGDYDGDGDIHDYSPFEICFSLSGPGVSIPSACDVFDLEPDLDVDAADFGAFNAIVVDEALMISPEGEGRYRRFLHDAKQVNANLRVVGLTATPFRTTTGMICGPDTHAPTSPRVRDHVPEG